MCKSTIACDKHCNQQAYFLCILHVCYFEYNQFEKYSVKFIYEYTVAKAHLWEYPNVRRDNKSYFPQSLPFIDVYPQPTQHWLLVDGEGMGASVINLALESWNNTTDTSPENEGCHETEPM